MKVIAVLVILSAAFTVGFGQSQSGTCTLTEQFTFVSGELPTTCGSAFSQIDPSNMFGTLLANVTARSGPLDTVCTAECGGTLRSFLSTCCEDPVGALGITTWCTPTGVDIAGQDRCYFTLPPVFNTSNFDGLSVCDSANETNPCPTGCMQALGGVAGALGCCFQSFYNNSVFIQGLQSTGAITQEDYDDLVKLGSALLWGACGVVPPSVCTGEAFPVTSTAAPVDVPASCPGGAVNVVPFVSLMLVMLLGTIAFLS